MAPKAKRARIEVEVKVEAVAEQEFTCPCNANHKYKSPEALERHKSSATHIAFAEWLKNHDHDLQKNDKILLNRQDVEISGLKVQLENEKRNAAFHFQQYQQHSCMLQNMDRQFKDLDRQCKDCLEYWGYPPQLLDFFPQYSVYQQCWWQS